MVDTGGLVIRLNLADGSTAVADCTALTVTSPEGQLVARAAFVYLDGELGGAVGGCHTLKFGKAVSMWNSVKKFFTKKGDPEDTVKTYVEDKGSYRTAQKVQEVKDEVKKVVERLVNGINFGVCGIMGAAGHKLVSSDNELHLRTMLSVATGKSKDDVNPRFYYSADASGALLYNRLSHFFPLDSSADSSACQDEYCIGMGLTVGPGAGAIVGAVAMEDG